MTVHFAVDGTGYYTYTVQAQDMAGNLSEALSRVAVHDEDCTGGGPDLFAE